MLHDSLRELVAVRGPGVVAEADELRGALDDFLAEEEATLGELNLLVDAVRLGALRRVLDVMDHGADPEAAIREAGAGLARDRGTDDPTRSCWAVASLCFALGRADEAMVRTFRGAAGTQSAPVPPPQVEPGHSTAERPGTQMLRDESSVPPPPSPPVADPSQPSQPSQPAPQSFPLPQPAPSVPAGPDPTVAVQVTPSVPTQPYGAPVPPGAREEKASRAGVFLLVVLVALILGGLVAAGFILLRSDDDDPAATDDPTTPRDRASATESASESESASDGPRQDRPLVSSDEMLVPYKEGDLSTVYIIDAIDGGVRTAISPDGVDARLPTLSPDRRTATYLEGPAPVELYRVDLETSSYEPFFSELGPCEHALRPGWSPDGSQVALSCTGDDEETEGIFLSPADGTGQPELIVEDSLVRGSPTWISPTRFVYGRQDDESETAPLTFWTVDIEEREPEELDVAVSGLQLTHIDWSEDAGKLLFLVSLPGEPEVGDIWTMNADGTGEELLAEGSYAHPVWSPSGDAIGVTVVDGDTEQLAYLRVDDPDQPVIVGSPPSGEVGVPVWGSR